jgi:hypothetical protein
MMVEKFSKPDSANRRKVLQGIGAGMVSVTGLSSSASALPDGDLAGIGYDTLTHRVGSEVTGNITERNGDLRGALNVAGFTIPLQELEPHPTSSVNANARFSAELTDREFRTDDVPLTTITQYDHHYAGILGRPSSEYGYLGFYVRDASNIDVEMALNRKEPHSRWENNSHSFAVPEEGVPTDTGLDRLMRIADEETDAQTNGGDY